MTKEEIEQYIDLDNKIKNRIVQINHALKDVNPNVVSKVMRKFNQDFGFWDLETYDKEDFIENSRQDKELHLGLACHDDDDIRTCHYDKNFLCLTDEQINEIVDYDRKVKEEEINHQKEAEKARQVRLKKEAEEKEYEQYLRLKKKFEKE